MKTITKEKISDLSIHELAATTPTMTTSQFDALVRDIDINGQLDPVVLYRGKIIDGRHRYRALIQLGVEFILCVKMTNNSTKEDIMTVIRSKETRRHESACQLAISAYRYMLSNPDKKLTQSDAANIFGANIKQLRKAMTIADKHKRPDILELLFNGDKLNIGSTYKPFATDSLITIDKWLSENRGVLSSDNNNTTIVELTEDENVYSNRRFNEISTESARVQYDIAKRLYHNALHLDPNLRKEVIDGK